MRPGGLGCCLVEGLEGQPEAHGVGGVVFRNESPEIRNIEMELVSEDEGVEFKRRDGLHGTVCRQGTTWKVVVSFHQVATTGPQGSPASALD